ncbi:hypothetical protein SEA_WOFFORD_268 [Streptomyces phage Wofford]|jgi:hypothetical protein|uniref:Uncharacterized protein n=5 Tax=Karimacvirus TaxID=2843400 RepID=A0A890USD3_9CAUD|nr:hypothetical protein [Streptomyces sp. JV178]YP_009839699.1 hypothetical protein HWB78_gp010 [Streptomyces phage Wollford]YP_009839911.1 hypothetical protein HWB78_gp051 [Streptomyces phage Wollford]YP_009840182.1 hypothetical protein HWB80_gp009 [Streptomyces phage Karimac]YP_009840396.1 hypothetical protein HWB80_gp056 [Streptomyces phage Karimac]AXH66520.1 hypothetical protein SEA_STARBOW_9 [Streptomyces phage Starbow]QDF17184.1 hypothetical protein SEA_BIRCHLYN_6 [Streptomyces phage Bi
MKAIAIAKVIAETPMTATVRVALVRNITAEMTDNMANEFETVALGLDDFEVAPK